MNEFVGEFFAAAWAMKYLLVGLTATTTVTCVVTSYLERKERVR